MKVLLQVPMWAQRVIFIQGSALKVRQASGFFILQLGSSSYMYLKSGIHYMYLVWDMTLNLFKFAFCLRNGSPRESYVENIAVLVLQVVYQCFFNPVQRQL